MHPLLAAAVVAVATWDAWRWYLGRIGSAPEEAAALGLTVLFFAVFGARQRSAPPLISHALLLPVSALLAVYALSFAVLPPIGRAALAITATLYCLYHAVFHDRPPLAFWGLVALALPVLPSLQFMLGYPMRIVSAAMTVGLLQAQGLMIERRGTFLLWRGEMVQFDAPCSGINMLWAGLLLTLMGCVLLRLSATKTIAAAMMSIIVSIAANVLRASSLFYVEAGILADVPTWWHDAIGLAAFTLSALAMLWILLRLEHWRIDSPRTANINAPETGPAR
jgi:exosortase/archaeosortase family protein